MNISNLTKLTHIDKEIIIDILEKRYQNSFIYTNIDDILISINPYKKLNIYDNYSNYNSPHIFDIASKSISNLKNSKKNQTILISGDSGGGKTFSTRCILNYFAHNFAENENICQQIINANPIIEIFGNAQTIMNDNSSRFGKFIKVYFDNNISNITGIQIDTYLLEKSRVCYQNNNDFNFHIFNQVAQKNKKSYKYCKHQPHNELSIDKTINMMIEFGFSQEEVLDIIKIIELILMIGEFDYNIKINWNEYTDLINFEDHITTQVLKIGSEKIIRKLKNNELEKNKFTIATQLYELTFHYVINKINHILNPNNIDNNFIGLLDIFGFEIFDYNNFEQLCINYTNEKLQNYHNYIIFQQEQELYKKEEINWEIIQYKDNSDILNIFENKYGIINLLDEECKLITSSNHNFHLKMQNLIKSDYLNINLYPNFHIQHYAGIVKYNCNNFCYKNKQKITPDLINYISNSSNIILSNSDNHPLITSSIMKSFTKELSNLMKEIKKTNSLFIKCIKPNNYQNPHEYDKELVYKQLLFSGIFEIIEISRSNYPIRYPIRDFYQKYNYVMTEFNLHNLTIKDIQFGKTTVFMKTNTFCHIENLLHIYKNNCAIIIQKNWKRYYMQKYYQNLKLSIIKIQATIRMFLQKRKYQQILRNILLCQSYQRMKVQRHSFLNKKQSCIKIQRYWRSKKYQQKLKDEKLKLEKEQKLEKDKNFCSHWPGSSKDSPTAFFITTDDIPKNLNDNLSLSEEKEQNKTEEKYYNLKKKYNKKKDILNKIQNKLFEMEKTQEENQELNKTLNEYHEINKDLVERLNNLLIANYQLQKKVEDERKKGVFNKLYDFLFN